MSKRIFLAIAALTMSCGVAFSKPVAITHAAEDETSEIVDDTPVIEEEEEIFECTVTDVGYWIDEKGTKTEDTAKKYGDVYITALEGHVGDVVGLVVATNIHFSYEDNKLSTFRYCVADVSVNGESLAPIEGNKYEFALVKGLNRVEVTYKGMTNIGVTDLSQLNFKSLLTLENVITFIVWAAGLILSSGFFIVWLKNKKIKASTIKEVVAATNTTIDDALLEKLPELLQTAIFPVINKVAEKEDANGQAIASLLKCLLASMSDDPKMKLAVTEELMKLQYTENNFNDQVKGLIEEYMKDAEAKKAAKKEAIEDLKEINDSIGSDGDGYGQL